MSDYIPLKKKFKSSFDILPNEILLLIFDYLTSNDIIYSFIDCNQRLQHLLLTQKYHFKLPTANPTFWNKILPIIGSQIQTLTINIDHLTISLDFFPNLTSIIIPSPDSLLDEELKSIINHQCFQKLHTLKIKDDIRSNPSSDDIHQNNRMYATYNEDASDVTQEDRTYSDQIKGFITKLTNLKYDVLMACLDRSLNPKNVLDAEQILFRKIFKSNNSLQAFEYLPSIYGLSYRSLHQLKSNIHIRSLTLNLTCFDYIFTLIQHAPNLIYLKIQLESSHQVWRENLWNINSDIKLEEFYLKLKLRRDFGDLDLSLTTGLNQLFRVIHLFSSSLITLSLHFTGIYGDDSGKILTNGSALENQLLKPLKKLQNFYFHVWISSCKDIDQILSTFQTFPWSVGVHQNAYLYSLPFSFHELMYFRHFEDVQSNNAKILKSDHRLWSKVTSLDLISINQIDFKSLFPLIKVNMPKLSSITLHGNIDCKPRRYDKSDDSCNEIDCVNVQLDSVTTVRLKHILMKHIEQILIHSFPNLQCLVLDYTELPSKTNELTSFLGQKLQRIEFDESSLRKFFVDEKVFSYLSNLKHFKLTYGRMYSNDLWFNSRSQTVSNLLTKIPKLETLSIYAIPCMSGFYYSREDIFHPIMNRLNENEIKAQYAIKYSGQYMWFIKKTISSSSI